ncbi:MAG: type III pantothenate kinase [Oscillospiraceae bacterium]
MLLVAIDAGNTNIVLGCLEGDKIRFTARVGTDRSKTEDEYALIFRDLLNLHGVNISDVGGAIISSVVSELKEVLKSAVELSTGKVPLMVGAGIKTGLNIKIDNPAQLGSDLAVDAVAACAKYKKPILIFDMGTATTLSVIDGKGQFRGGMIMAGPRLAVDALSSRTSQLPRIELDAPAAVIGSNTVDCMQAGAIYGNAAMLDGIIDRVEEALGEPVGTAVATGGMASRITPYCRRNIICDDSLMLRGLQIIYEKNS